MRFLKRCFAACIELSLRGLRPPLPSEPLARFIVRESWIQNGHATLDAFLPARDGETSTFRLTSVAEWRRLLLGRLAASAYTKGALRGHTEVPAGAVTQVHNLYTKADLLSLHVGIRGWPPSKPMQKQWAALIASYATTFREYGP